MKVYVVMEIDNLPCKETLTAKCSGGAEISVSGYIKQRWNTYIVDVVTTEDQARQAIEDRKKELVAMYGTSILDDETAYDRKHRYFTFRVETREVILNDRL